MPWVPLQCLRYLREPHLSSLLFWAIFFLVLCVQMLTTCHCPPKPACSLGSTLEFADASACPVKLYPQLRFQEEMICALSMDSNTQPAPVPVQGCPHEASLFLFILLHNCASKGLFLHKGHNVNIPKECLFTFPFSLHTKAGGLSTFCHHLPNCMSHSWNLVHFVGFVSGFRGKVLVVGRLWEQPL